jgi:hypothetical protein
VEAGSNTSTVSLRVVRGDEMGLKKRPRHSLSGQSLASYRCGPGIETGSVMWDFVVDKVALG